MSVQNRHSAESGSALPTAPQSGGPLSALTADLNRHSLAHAIGLLTPDAPTRIPSTDTDRKDETPMPQLDMLAYFRGIWSQLHSQQQIRQSQVQIPDNAGPLNSSRIISQALARLQTLSPAYLREQLAYLDTLAQLESLPTPAPAKPPARPAAPGRKPAPTRKAT